MLFLWDPALKMETVYFFETFVSTYESTRSQNLEKQQCHLDVLFDVFKSLKLTQRRYESGVPLCISYRKTQHWSADSGR
jgi:hypothetical protein